MSTIEQALAKLQATGAPVAPAARPESRIPNAVALAGAKSPRPPNALLAQHRQPGATDQAQAFLRLPIEHMREIGLLTPDASRSKLAEEYRAIKRPLLMNIDKKGADLVDHANLIMITSALPKEGKTFTAINLAISISMERDRTVLLVDGDVARPSVAERLGVTTELGLTDLLASEGQIALGSLLLNTSIPNLRFLPAGSPHDRATELLASEYMATVMREFSTRYHDRVVIFDSPPLLLTSESATLASMMGQVLLVVAAEQTPQHVVADAITRLSEEQILGLVLNKYNPTIGNRETASYGYYYYAKEESDQPAGPDKTHAERSTK